MKTWKKLALMVALGSLAAMTAEAETRGVTDDKVIIGSHSDLSGPLASWGVSAINGAKMRIDDFNAAGGANGRTIEFLVEDSQYQVPLAVRATNRLVQRGDVFAILLGTGTGQPSPRTRSLTSSASPTSSRSAQRGRWPNRSIHCTCRCS